MDFFGLDIGSHVIKAVQLAKRGDKYSLVTAMAVPSTNKGLLSESEADLTALAMIVKKLYNDAKIRTKNVASAIPQDQVSAKLITLPKLTEDELDSALKWEAEQYVPFPLSEATLAHQIIGQIDDANQPKIEVLLVATPTRLIDKLIKVLKTAGLNPVSLEMEISAIARSLAPPGSKITMVVDLGAKATDLAIVENGQVILTHSVSTAGEALTRAVAYNLGLDANQAEAYKKAYGVDSSKLEGKITNAIDPILEVIVKEMEKTIQYFQTKGKGINQIVLTGGTSGLPDVASWLAKKLNIEIQIGNPFSQVTVGGILSKINTADVPLYACAVGLALKEIS
jgi:type IV pilus assembly protein PilM